MDITDYKPSIYNVHVLSTNKTDHITINGIPTNSFALDVTDPLEITVTGKTYVHVTINGEEIIPKYSHVVDYHTIGNYVQGDMVWNQSPVAGGYMGWVCVRDGNPGIWKSFGKIAE